jgi:hypothetical protein
MNFNSIPNDFNYIEYKYLNKDLDGMNELECIKHYLNYGIKELRHYKYFKKKIINDSGYNEEYAINILKNNKNFESNISIPNDFNYIQYKYLNKDLDGMNELECIKHYLNYGIKELRQYKFILPNDFNYIQYKYLNKDLHEMNELECIKHYLNYGIKESRHYKYNLFEEDFDYNEYKYLNKDLSEMTESECIIHYLTYGHNEYRYYNKKYLIKLYILYYFNNDTLNIDISNITENDIDNFKKVIDNIKSISIYLLELYIMLEKYYSLNLSYKNDISLSHSEFNFDNIYNIIINNKKEHFKYLCYRYINYIKNRKININYNFENHNETVLIEFRILYHIEFNIRNMCSQLPNWKHTIICGNNNYTFIKTICDNISFNINIIKINKDNINIDEYSKFVASTEFWNLLTGSHILIHQDDSLIFKSDNIEEWLKYDYVGAPWPKDTYDERYLVGNGGFSLRKRETMIKICSNYDINTYEIFDFTKKYMIDNNLSITPEDCFFVKCMVDNNIGIIPLYDIAQYFSSESICCLNSIGGHCFWLSDDNWIDRFNIIIKQFSCSGIKYIKHYNHRYGWNNLLMILYINDIITLYNKNDNVELVDLCENFFIWHNNKISNKWIGIVHLTPSSPKYLENLNVTKLLNNINFNDSLKYCVKLITLSDYLKKYIKNNIEDIEIINMYHPIKNVSKKFSLENYLNNTNKNIIQIGQQLRIFKTFLNLEFMSHNKIWICNNIEIIINNLNKELNTELQNIEDLNNYLNIYNINYINLNNEDYDNLITQNIIFIHLYDSSANNTLLESIIYKIPIIINKHPAIIEYLGNDYPLYYTDICELNDNFIKDDKIIEAYNYLCNMDNTKIMYKNFCEELLEIIN